VKLRPYFFALASVLCLLIPNVFVAGQKIDMGFDDLYPQTPFATSLNLTMQILGELKAYEVQKEIASPEVLRYMADLMKQLKSHMAQIDRATMLADDIQYLDCLLRCVDHSYQKFMRVPHELSKKCACYCISIKKLTPTLQLPN
jgi:hypothetical protein